MPDANVFALDDRVRRDRCRVHEFADVHADSVILSRRQNSTSFKLESSPVRLAQFILNGAEPGGGTPDGFLALVKRETGDWAGVKKTGLKPRSKEQERT